MWAPSHRVKPSFEPENPCQGFLGTTRDDVEEYYDLTREINTLTDELQVRR